MIRPLSARHQAILAFGVRGGDGDDDAGLRDALDTAGQGAQDRIANAGTVDTTDVDGGQDGAPAGGPPTSPAPPAGRQPPAPPDPNAVRDDMPYRDAAALRREMADYRQRYEPLEQAFGALPDEALAQLANLAPTVGEDLSTIAGAFADLHPDDRKYLAQVVGTIRTDPATAAQHLARVAEALGGQGQGQGQGAPPAAGGDDEYLEPGSGDVMTRADVERFVAREWEERTSNWQQQQEFERIDHELDALGYNLGNETPQRDAEIMAILQYAGRTGRSLADARSDLMAAWGQQSVDTYVEGKRKDGGRRPAPTSAGAGASSSGERQLDTLTDAQDAMLARLDAAGMQGRRRAG